VINTSVPKNAANPWLRAISKADRFQRGDAGDAPKLGIVFKYKRARGTQGKSSTQKKVNFQGEISGVEKRGTGGVASAWVCNLK